MKIPIDMIFIIVLVIIILCFYCEYKNNNIEKFENVNDADISALRNLNSLANKLTTGGLTVPGSVGVTDNISVTNNSNEGGRVRIINGKKTAAGQTNDWSIWNMTGDYGNKLSFWRYNGDGANAGPVLDLNDNGSVNMNGDLKIAGNLRTAGEFKTPNGHTIRCDGRQHIMGEELLYVLNKSGVIIGKEWGGNGNLQVQGALSVGGVNIRDFVPVIINFNAPGRDHSYQDRTFPFNQKSVALLLWPINEHFHPRYHTLRARLQSKGVEVEGSVRHIADFRTYIQVSVSIPPGKMVKFWNWGGIIRKLTGGHHHLNIADFGNGPHMMWIGYEEYDDHIPDSYNLASNNGGW